MRVEMEIDESMNLVALGLYPESRSEERICRALKRTVIVGITNSTGIALCPTNTLESFMTPNSAKTPDADNVGKRG